jgi:predicted DNA-binding protein (UPF0251 family)
MPRPFCPRYIDARPSAAYFKPAGIPARLLEEVVLTLDELEALRLADFEGLYHEKAAEQMKISRPTFSRVVEQARRKVASALIQGKALRVDGGAVVMKDAPGAGMQCPIKGKAAGECGKFAEAQPGGARGKGCPTADKNESGQTTVQKLGKKEKS